MHRLPFSICNEHERGIDLMEKRHILLCGHRGVGKSTLIRKLLEDAGLPVYGFMTKSTHYREDGYHDIRSIMLPIDFYDELEINVADQDLYWCNKSFIRFNENNSIIKMISILKDKYHITDHHDVKLNKCVPIKAGLGGGTADGASVLRIFRKRKDKCFMFLIMTNYFTMECLEDLEDILGVLATILFSMKGIFCHM